jgi:hypothetical protein
LLSLRKAALLVAVAASSIFLAAPSSASAAPAGSTPQPGWICAGDGNTTMLWLSNKDGRTERFWVGSDRALWHDWQVSVNGGFHEAASLGGWMNGCIDGTANADGRLEMFVRAGGGDLDHIWQTSPNGGWNPQWESLGGQLAGPIFVYNTSPDLRVVVDVLGTDQLWHEKWQWRPNCCWFETWGWPGESASNHG